MALGQRLLTKVITGDTYTLPAGAKEIFLQNIGAGNVTWKGDYTDFAQTNEDIVLQKDKSFSYPMVGVGRPAITFDATASVLQISAFY